MDVVSKEKRAELDELCRKVEDKAWEAINKLKIPQEEWCCNPLLTLAERVWQPEPEEVPVWLEEADMHPERTPRGCSSLTDLLINGPRLTYSEEKQEYVPVEPEDYPWGTLYVKEFLAEKDPQRVMELAGQAIFSGDLEGTLEETGPLDSLTGITRD